MASHLNDTEDTSYADHDHDPCIDDEDRLDEDFLFYLSFTKVFMRNLEESQEIELCESWLQKLCGQVVNGVRAKRSRNIYLSNLILLMLEGQLSGPFMNRPPRGKLVDAVKVFAPEQLTAHEEPEWMQDLNLLTTDLGKDYTHHSADGRTYVASKQLPNGRGAFGFISITLGDKEDEDKCPGVSQQRTSDTEMPEEVKELLDSRTPESLRNNLIRFYERMISSIDNELAGVGLANDSVNLMMENLDEDIKCKCKKARLDAMEPEMRRIKLLEMIREKLVTRMEKVKSRGIILDDLEEKAKAKLRQEFGPHEEILIQEANRELKPPDMHALERNYPQCLIDKFLELLTKEKLHIIAREREQLAKFEAEVRKDQIAIIKEGVEKYKAARKEWEEIASIVDSVQKAIKKGHAEYMAIQPSIGADNIGRKHMQSLQDEVEREQHNYEKSMHESQRLREVLETELDKSQNVLSCSMDERDTMKKDNISLRNEIETLQVDISFKQQKVQELENMINH